jgi:hypothetical protein
MNQPGRASAKTPYGDPKQTLSKGNVPASFPMDSDGIGAQFWPFLQVDRSSLTKLLSVPYYFQAQGKLRYVARVNKSSMLRSTSEKAQKPLASGSAFT